MYFSLNGSSEPFKHSRVSKEGVFVEVSLRAMSSEGVTVTGAEEYPVFESFDDYDLKENLLRGIYSYGFEKPSAIQQRGIKPILDGRDTIGQAQSGTGKTATFVIGCLQRVDYSLHRTQALILAPTRELANQIYKASLAFGDYLKIKSAIDYHSHDFCRLLI